MRLQARRGAAAIEFALVAPVMLLMVTGVIEWGRYTNQQQVVLHAVREGARMGAGLTAGGVSDEQEVIDLLSISKDRTITILNEGGLDGTGATVVTDIERVDDVDMIRVTATVPYQPIVGLVPTPEALQAQLAMLADIR